MNPDYRIDPSSLKNACVKIRCGNEQGTGFWVTSNLILTAYHVVENVHDEDDPEKIGIEIHFPELSVHSGILCAWDQTLDVAILQIENHSCEDWIDLVSSRIRENENWRTFGFPKILNGGGDLSGRIVGSIVDRPYDVLIQAENVDGTTDYSGLSGAPLLVEGTVVGMITYQVDSRFGATTITRINDFLAENEVLSLVAMNEQELPAELAVELDFIVSNRDAVVRLEEFLNNSTINFCLISGNPGTGKTILAASFLPRENSFEVIARYFFKIPNESRVAALRISKESLLESLEDAFSGYLTGKPQGREDLTPNQRLGRWQQLMKATNQSLQEAGKVGIIFIDGLDEVVDGSGNLADILGILPEESRFPNLKFILGCTTKEILPPALASQVTEENEVSMANLEAWQIRRIVSLVDSENSIDLANVERIVELSEGHPLYTRYLIEIALADGDQPIDDRLADLPAISGDIRKYYFTYWSRVKNDPMTSWIAGLLASIRRKISTEDLRQILDTGERKYLDSAKRSLSHLLFKGEELGFYHSSFSMFVQNETSAIAPDLHSKIAEYCTSNLDFDLSVEDIIFHLLRSNRPDESWTYCDQNWADRAARKFISPDQLLSDIRDTIAFTVSRGNAVELIRLQLLLSRLHFRYDQMFAKFTFDLVKLLLAKSMPAAAMRYLVRGKLLLVGMDDALYFLQIMVENGFEREAFKLEEVLSKIGRRMISEAAKDWTLDPQGVKLVVNAAMLLFPLNPEYAMEVIERNQDIIVRVATPYWNEKTQPPKLLRDLIGFVKSHELGYRWRIQKRVEGPGKLSEKEFTRNSAFTGNLAKTALQFYGFQKVNFQKETELTYSAIVDQIQKSYNAYGCLEDEKEMILSVLLESGDDSKIVLELLGDSPRSIVSEGIRKGNGVDCDKEKLNAEFGIQLRSGYRDSEFNPPGIVPKEVDWEQFLISNFVKIGYLTGAAYRAKADKAESRLKHCVSVVWDQLNQFQFSLAERVKWERAYSIPEEVLPFVFLKLAYFIVEFTPSEYPKLVGIVNSRRFGQMGVYQEGYRELLDNLIGQISGRAGFESEVAVLLGLLEAIVLKGAINRTERIPWLMKVGTYYSQLGNRNGSDRSLENLFASSMGPGWYKEDQFALINTLLKRNSAERYCPDNLKDFAVYLEHASGEMTFQRFVRYSKQEFIGNLIELGRLDDAIEYFKYQVLPSPSQILRNADSGDVDAPRKGDGYVLGANSIVDAGGILAMLESIPQENFSFKWVLSEVYLVNQDTKRYFDGFVRQLINCIIYLAGRNTGMCDEYLKRLLFILHTPECLPFVETATREIEEALPPDLKTQLNRWSSEMNLDLVVDATPWQVPTKRERTDFGDDQVMMPGVFGNLRSFSELEDAMQEASEFLAQGNGGKAAQRAANGLQEMHAGQWDVWGGNLGKEATEAYSLIAQNANEEEFLGLLKGLIIDHPYTAEWSVADKLIRYVPFGNPKAAFPSITTILSDHFQYVLGTSEDRHERMEWRGTSEVDVRWDVSLGSFCIWLLNHPYRRVFSRTKDALFWAAKLFPDKIIPLLFERIVNHTPEIECLECAKLLNAIAAEKPKFVWEQVRQVPEFMKKVESIGHFLITWNLYQTVKQFQQAGIEESRGFANAIEMKFPRQTLLGADCFIDEPWFRPVASILEDLAEIGISDRQFCEDFIGISRESILPLDFAEAIRSQSYIYRSFSEDNVREGRYNQALRYAINIAILRRAEYSKIDQIASILMQ